MRVLLGLLLLAGCTAPPPAAPAGDGPVWLFFADRATPDESLARAEAELHPRAAARRARNRADGSVVDGADLPLDPNRLAQLQALGLTLRAQSRRLRAVSVDRPDAGQLDEALRLPFVTHARGVARGQRPPPPAASARAERDDPPPSPFDYGPAGPQLAALGVPGMHGLGYTGDGVVLAIADTGFHLQNEAIAGLAGQILGSWDFIHDDGEVDDEPGDDPSQARHGSIVLSAAAANLDGTLVGAAPGVSLLLAKTERVQLEAAVEEDWWVAGVEWAEQEGADVLTSSLGWIDWYEPEDLDGATAVSTVFVEELIQATGLIVTSSMGNLGPGSSTLVTPADAASVLSIGATTIDGTPAAFSSRGPTADGRTKPDLAGPGVDVAVVDWDHDTDLDTASGTSLATPLVAGVIALLIEAHPEWTREELVGALKSTASSAAEPDNGVGWGTPDAFEACGLRCTCHDEDADGHYDEACGGDDCDDEAAQTRPGADELCDGADNDCDGLADDESDVDGDGQRPCAGDCDDADPALNGLDADGDGDPSCGTDCDDADPTRNGLDADGDGLSSCDGDCADWDAGRSPELAEVPYDGVDQDCDGADLVDVDRDGFAGGPGPDCHDGDRATYPDPIPKVGAVPVSGGHELCSDGRDNDCDGALDEEDPDCADFAVASDTAEDDSVTLDTGCSCSVGSTQPPLPLLLLLLTWFRGRACRPSSSSSP